MIVELNLSELRRAEEVARARNRPKTLREKHGAALAEDEAYWEAIHVLGAQGEIAVAKLLGIDAPLHVNTFRRAPDLPPDWHVKTTFARSRFATELRVRPDDLGHGGRFALVERDFIVGGGFAFEVHGWISAERVERDGRQRWVWDRNLFVSRRHLEPIEPLSGLDEAYWADRLDRHLDLA